MHKILTAFAHLFMLLHIVNGLGDDILGISVDLDLSLTD